MSEEPKKEEIKPKEECPKEKCKNEGSFGFQGFGPRCHWKGRMGPHKCKERKCECGEVIPKRKEGEPKIKICPKCGKDLPKKEHGFGMRCHKMMKYMHMMRMMNTCGPFGFGFGPRYHMFGPPPYHRGLEVHHYIHFGPPTPFGFGRPPIPPFWGRHMGPPGFYRPPMPPFWGRHMGPPGFGRPPMPRFFGRPPMGPGFGRPPMGFGFPHFGPHHPHGPCEMKEEPKKE